jgi:hypothetical protein
VITVFTAPKAFEGHIGIIQANAIRSWKALGNEVEILVIGDEEGMERATDELAVKHVPGVARNENDTPVLSSIFNLAHEHGNGAVYCYANADILFFRDFLATTERFERELAQFLVVGRRWDVRIDARIEEGGFRGDELVRRLLRTARAHPPGGSDYFVFPKGQFEGIPRFALGRSGWDNWMIYSARRRGIPVVDASEGIRAIHQDHDYAHLPGGQSHYRLPETQKNIQLAGGREMMFTLHDATWTAGPHTLDRLPWWYPNLVRRIETGLYCRLGPGALSRSVRLITHPRDTLRYLWRRAFARRASQSRESDMLESAVPNRSDPGEI